MLPMATTGTVITARLRRGPQLILDRRPRLDSGGFCPPYSIRIPNTLINSVTKIVTPSSKRDNNYESFLQSCSESIR